MPPDQPRGTGLHVQAAGNDRVGVMPERPRSLENAGLLGYGIAP